MWEVGLHPLLWSFPPTTNFTSFPAPGYWTYATTPAFSSQLVYLQFHEFLFGTHGALPSLLRVFTVIANYSVSLFSLGGSQSVQGLC
jgi:hypothetical protein